MAESTGDHEEREDEVTPDGEPRTEQAGNDAHVVNEARVRLYEQMMEAQDLIAEALYLRGVDDTTIVNALNAAATDISDEERREDLYLSSLAVYVNALGGRLEVRAVFGDESFVVRDQ